MQVTATTDAPPATDADTVAVGIFEDEGVPHDHGGVLQALVDSGEAKRAFRKLAVTRAEGKRYVLVGLGGRSDFDPERARVAAASVAGRAQELGTKTLCWEVPHHVTDAHAGALVEGTVIASYAYREFKAQRRQRRDRRPDPVRAPRRERSRGVRRDASRRPSTPPAISRTARPTCSRRPRSPSARRRCRA